MIEILDEPPLPGGSKIKRCHEGREESNIPHADGGFAESEMRGCMEPQSQHFRVGRCFVCPTEGLDTRLPKFGRALPVQPPLTKYLPEIAEPLRSPGGSGAEIFA